jgi:hypothetical protein
MAARCPSPFGENPKTLEWVRGSAPRWYQFAKSLIDPIGRTESLKVFLKAILGKPRLDPKTPILNWIISLDMAHGIGPAGLVNVPLKRYNEKMLYLCVISILDSSYIAGFEPKRGKEGKIRYYDIPKQWKRLCSQLPERLTMNSWCDLMKYKLVQHYNGWSVESSQWQTPPVDMPLLKEDHPRVLLGGTFYRWECRLNREDPDLFRCWLSSCQSSKSLMPDLDPWSGFETAKDTFSLLTTARQDPPDSFLGTRDQRVKEMFGEPVPSRLSLSRSEAEFQIRRTVKEYLRDGKRFDPLGLSFFPSTRSNIDFKVSEGGTLPSLRDDLVWLRGHLQMMGEQLLVPEPRTLQLFDLDPIATLNFRDLRDLGSDEEVERYVNDLTEIELSVQPMDASCSIQGVSYNDDYLKLAFRELLGRVMERCTGNNRVVILTLFEAMKFRNITKSSPQYGFVAKPLQAYLWKILSNHRVCQLTGTTVTEEIMQQVSELRDGEKWNNGDYKDATNNFRGWASHIALEQVCDTLQVPSFLRSIYHKTLEQHTIVDPEDPEHEEPQVEGQLMGSILSFPILCMVNTSIVRWSMEIGEGRTLTLAQVRLLINGDDFVAPMNEVSYRAWRSISAYHGLAPSLGKTYFTREFAMINSAEFRSVAVRQVGDSEFHVFRKVKKLHCGLLAGKGKTGNSEKLNTENIGAMAHQLLDTLPKEWKNRALSQFIVRHRIVLDRAGSRPWFLPTWLGGLGLPNLERKLTQKDRRVAEAMLLSLDNPLPKYVPDVPWQLHKRVSDRLPTQTIAFKMVSCEGVNAVQQTEVNYSRLYTDLCIETMIRKPLASYFSPHKENDPSVAINKILIRRWEKALGGCCGGPGLSDWDLDTRRRLDYFPIFFDVPESHTLQGVSLLESEILLNDPSGSSETTILLTE